MKLAITGGTGFVGRFLVEEALAAGDSVTLMGRRPAPGLFAAPVAVLPYRLGDAPDLAGHDALIHCAFAHVAGRYRGGEGDDPEGFTRTNLGGSLALFEAAKAAGVGRVLFLSSRAVYGAYPPGTDLDEALPPNPDTLYGRIKLSAEQSLAGMSSVDFTAISLRATGVYGPAGPGQTHKWHAMFRDFLAGQTPPPRAGTELHGQDLAAAARLLLGAPPGAYNLSDILLDRHDLLAEVAALTGCGTPLPARATAATSAMQIDRIRALGWRPGGIARLRATLPALL